MKLDITRKSFLLVFLVILADQALKLWVKSNMHLGQEISLIGNRALIHFTENNGMAFGYEIGGEYGKLALSLFRILAVIGIIWYIRHLVIKEAPQGLILSISLILAGAIGNIIDSAFYGMIFSESFMQPAQWFPEGGGYASFLHGRVVDMLYFPVIQGRYPSWLPFVGGDPFIFFRPVFNIADTAITTGVLITLVFYRKFFK
ncbi:MAG: lipoprotein signal peptidase [Marinilabiliales bacterium]|nr:MAG: lipoprotein signal peptidase [Marinilabiliales bacterium]